jgi:predicted YcjX-like family ATPase
LTLLKYGPQYSIEKQENTNILNTIIDTENAIKLLNNGQQNVFRHLAARKVKRILHCKAESNHLHKRQWHGMKQLKEKLTLNNLSVIPAD